MNDTKDALSEWEEILSSYGAGPGDFTGRYFHFAKRNETWYFLFIGFNCAIPYRLMDTNERAARAREFCPFTWWREYKEYTLRGQTRDEITEIIERFPAEWAEIVESWYRDIGVPPRAAETAVVAVGHERTVTAVRRIPGGGGGDCYRTVKRAFRYVADEETRKKSWDGFGPYYWRVEKK